MITTPHFFRWGSSDRSAEWIPSILLDADRRRTRLALQRHATEIESQLMKLFGLALEGERRLVEADSSAADQLGLELDARLEVDRLLDGEASSAE